MLPSGARDVGGRVLAPDLLRSPPENFTPNVAYHIKIPPDVQFQFPILTRFFQGQIDKDATHQRHHEQVQKSDQSHQQ